MFLEDRAGSQCGKGHGAESSEEKVESCSGLEEEQEGFAVD